METLLIDRKLAPASQQALIDALLDNKVELFGDSHIQTLSGAVQCASEADWEAEYLDLRLAVKTVDGVQEAIDHINRYSSNHTEAILSTNKKEISHFLNDVDSASLIVNASTRFSDGGEYGLGCEIGISTDKLHARGPMGIDDLTTYKWIVEGSGQIRG
jgi:glutamate-5-semialdehyde dehydrogenase